MASTKTKQIAMPKKFRSRDWIESLEKDIHSFVNRQRKRRKLRKLILGKHLSKISKKHSQDMCKNHFYSHINKQGVSPSGRAKLADYKCPEGLHSGLEENIIQRSVVCGIKETNAGNIKSFYSRNNLAEALVMGWMHSPGHKINILDKTISRHGIGVSISSKGEVFATSNFC